MLNTFLKFDVSIFSVILLLLILVTLEHRKDTMSYTSRLFRRLVFINIFMLVMEIVSWQFDMKPGSFNWYANYIANMVFGWATPIITCMWAVYVDYRIFGSVKRLRKRWYYMQPIIANTILFTINLFIPIVFRVSPENVYSRQPFMWMIVLINTLTLAYMCGLAYKNRSITPKKVINTILMFVFLPALAAGVQVAVYGVFVMWPTMAVTLVATYIYLETSSTSSDYLTGLYSRIRLDEYIDLLLNTDQEFGVIMLDLNDFKSINDTFGHHIGDEALVLFSNALSKVFHNEKMTGRYAGDEFVIVTHILDETQLEVYNNQIDEFIKYGTEVSQSNYDLSFSMGYQGSVELSAPTYSTMMNAADAKMYSNKKLFKEAKKSR